MAPSSMTPISIGAPHPWPSSSSSSSSSLASPPSSKAYSYNYDCSLSLCSTNCPQFCGVVLPPPPPLFLNPNDGGADDSSPSSHISPLMAALIAVLAAAFLLLFYFTVISRLCRRRRRSNQTRFLDPDNADRIDSLIYDSARPTTNNESGLDDSFIRQITVFKFRREDKLVDGTECAVCLTEFNENESLRLMPNCEHAFHLPCIDTWLKTHSSCPLCRSTMNSVPVPVPNPNPTSRSGLGSIGSAANTNATAATASVAALRVQLSDDAVLVIRELESRVQVFETTTAADEVGSLGGAECRNYIIEDNNNHNHNNNINRETKLEINNNNHRNSR